MDLNQLFNDITSIFVTTALFLLVLYQIFRVLFYFKRRKLEQTEAYKLTFFHIKMPKDNEIEIKAAEHMFSNLMGFKKGYWGSRSTGEYRISFEIVGKSTGISFYVVVPDEIATLVEKQINAAYPSAEIDIIDPHEVWDRGDFTRIHELKLKGAAYYPIKNYEDMKNDSLSSITNAMSKLGPGETVAVQFVLEPANDTWRLAGRQYCTSVKNKANDPEKKVNIDTSFLEGIEKKTNHSGFYVAVRIVAISDDRQIADGHVKNMVSAFEQFTDINYNRFIRADGGVFYSYQGLVDDFIYRRIRVRHIHIPIMNVTIYLNKSVLNTVEMATVFHFPNKEVETPNIVWLSARRSPAPTNLPTEGILLGKSVYRGVEKKIYMKEKDRTRHFYIIGQTGTGKSVFMMWLAQQDIANGEGLAIIDPHGTDIDELLTKIPEHRLDDVVLWDVSDTERPMGLNMLEANSEEEKHMVINAFIALLYKLYDPNRQGIMGPQLERSIRNVMLTAMVEPESTMVDVLRLLIDSKYSKRFIDKLEDPLVKRFWTDEIAKTSDFHKSEKMGYFVSKFDKFVTDKLMRNILGQPKSAFNFDKIMAEKKILLVDLAKGKIGEENSNFLGLLLVPRILSAALGRHKLIGKGGDFPNFFLYVDEFQNFATPDFATILSEARKYKLNLVVAHQFVSQLDEAIKNAIFGNVGTMCSFRVGTDDAEYLENYFGPTFTAQDLSSLAVGNAYTRLLVDGHPTPPFSMKIDWNDINAVAKSEEMAEKIRHNSRMKYGKPADEVEKFINDRAGFNEPKEQELPPFPGFGKGRIPF